MRLRVTFSSLLLPAAPGVDGGDPPSTGTHDPKVEELGEGTGLCSGDPGDSALEDNPGEGDVERR